MTARLSTGLRNAMLAGGSSGGFKGALHLGFIAFYSGPQPLTADSAASGTLLGTVSVNGSGTGLTFENPVAGVVSKTAAEAWRLTGVADGTAGWFRFYPATGNPATSSSTEARLDGTLGTANADIVVSNIAIRIGVPVTVDQFSFSLPAQ